MERKLSFEYIYLLDLDVPDTLKIKPKPQSMSDNELILTTTICIQTLASTHGLEQALKLITEAVYGKIQNNRFDTHWSKIIGP